MLSQEDFYLCFDLVEVKHIDSLVFSFRINLMHLFVGDRV